MSHIRITRDNNGRVELTDAEGRAIPGVQKVTITIDNRRAVAELECIRPEIDVVAEVKPSPDRPEALVESVIRQLVQGGCKEV